jgi:hypothetical protein
MIKYASEPSKLERDTVRPSTLISENVGAFVPNGSIVLAVFTILQLLS